MITVNTEYSGIYCIQNILDNKGYIGSAINIRKRFNSHKSELENNIHHCIHLQNAYNKYGKENFKFFIISRCPIEYLLKLEQWFINCLKPEYNILKVAGSSLGHKHTEEQKEKNRLAHLGKKWTKESIDKRNETVRKQVYQYDLEGKYITSFHGVRLAGDLLNIPYQQIVSCCTNKRVKQAGGFQWRYSKLDCLSKVIPNKRYTKKLYQYDKDFNLIKIWNSLTEAANILNINKGNIANSARRKGYYVIGGYRWKYD